MLSKKSFCTVGFTFFKSRWRAKPVSDIDIAVADSLKVLDLKRPIREASEIARHCNMSRWDRSRHRSATSSRIKQLHPLWALLNERVKSNDDFG
jgi:hypothetical protein